MDQIFVIIVLVVGAPLVTGIWLIVRAIRTQDRLAELTRRVDDLELQLLKAKPSSPVAAKVVEEKTSGFQPASLPPRKSEADISTPPPPVEPAVTELPTDPLTRPPVDEPEPSVSEPPIIPPPIIPSWFQKPESKAGPIPEPVLETAQIATPPAAAVPPPEKASFEMRLGTYWLVRAGIVMLLTGLAFFANFAYHHVVPKLGPGGKIALLYLASGLLLGAGAWWQRRSVKESLKNYGQVLFAGGLAAVYFTTYAAHHIPPLCIIGSALLDGLLLLAWAGFIAFLADRRKSEVMALFAVGLAFYSSVITHVGEFTLYSNFILTIAAVVFLVRNRWVGLSFASLATSYAGYIFWRFLHEDGWRWAAPDENLWLGAGFLASYWLVFTAATFLSKSEQLTGPNRAAFLTLNNGAFFALFLLTMLQVHTGGFWKVCLGYGTVLLGLAALAQKLLPAEPPAKNAYLTQGLLLVTLGFISKFAGLQLALVLGVESVVLFLAGSQRQSLVLKFFAFAAATLATGWCVASLHRFDDRGLWTGTGLGALLAFNAFWAHRLDAGKSTQPLRAEPTLFTLLALAGWLATTWFNTTEANLPPMLAAEGVALTFSIYLLRVREITLLGQLFPTLAQVALFAHFLNATPPWWNPLTVIAVTVGLGHWWQRQKTLVADENFRIGCQAFFALAAVALALVWLHPLVAAPTWLALTSLLAVTTTIYGVATRAWMVAICGQFFLAGSTWEFFTQVWTSKPEWFFPLAPVAGLALLSLTTVGWFARQPDSRAEVRNPLLQIARLYRWIALAMSLCWLWQYVPDRQHVGAFMAVAIGVFALAVRRRNREALLASAVYAAASIFTLWAVEHLKIDAYWLNLLSLLALLIMQQILRRSPEPFSLDETIHGTVIFIAGVSLWRLLACWVTTSGIFLTMSWAGFAVVVFALGFFLRERFHRWLGLGVLAAAVGRVVLVDVWKQGTIYRVLTFMALGVALLVVGFIYNKYQEKIRQWL